MEVIVPGGLLKRQYEAVIDAVGQALDLHDLSSTQATVTLIDKDDLGCTVEVASEGVVFGLTAYYRGGGWLFVQQASAPPVNAKAAPCERGLAALRLAAKLLPRATRSEWLEEHRAYLTDLPTPRAKALWAYRELRGMPRYAYTVRTSARRKEPA